MTDYLEELLDRADALLDQVRRLERSGAGAFNTPEGEEASPWDRGGRSAGETAPAEERTAPGLRVPAAGRAAPRSEGGEALELPERTPTPLELEEGRQATSPLLEQVERLERAAAPVGSAVTGGQWDAQMGWSGGGRQYAPSLAASPAGAVSLDISGGPGGDWSAGSAPERPLPGGEQSWAEQADRAFRRDSRRYDGGFYLY